RAGLLWQSGFRQEHLAAPGRGCLAPRHCGYVAVLLLALGIGRFGTGEFDEKLIRLDLDPDHMILDHDCILNLCRYVEVTTDGFDDEGFDLVCRDPAEGAGLFGPSLQQSRR